MGARLALPLRTLLDGVANDWAPLLQAWAASAAGQALCAAVDARVAAGRAIYPPDPFLALRLTPRSAVRALILGQDPYHGPGQAEGLAFSVAQGQRWPPSLRNILQEWQRDLGQALPASGSLRPWAEQGVLLLNTVLTVEHGEPASHAKLGWQVLTEEIVKAVAESGRPTAFLLWGAHAQAQAAGIAAGQGHLLLQCNHPSPLAARRPPVPFMGCGHFGASSRFLAQAGRGALAWRL